jgi:Raf kinase inhibitor-like YbhB/YbcL family protein
LRIDAARRILDPMSPMLVRRSRSGSVTTAVAAAALFVAACGPTGSVPAAPTPVNPEAPSMASVPSTLVLRSPAFADGAPIPAEFSCRGADVSPPLAWTGVPADAAALVLFVDDPDGRDWAHWSVLDLPARDGSLPRGVPAADDPPHQGRNDFGRVGYGGPCPPSGNHHYRFTLYALASPLGLTGHPAGAAVRAALAKATVVARTTLTGTFRA